MKKMLLCMLVIVCLVLGLFSIGWMDAPYEVSEEKFNLAQECFAISFPTTKNLASVEEVRNSWGEVFANQYVGAINRFYDTGNSNDLFGLYLIMQGDSCSEYISYVPGSASPASATAVTEAPFPDVPTDAWYAKAVSEMKDSGIIEGCDDGLFHPERPVTIGELYAMLVRAITSTRIDATVATGVSNDTHWANGVMENARRAYLWPPENEHVDDYVLRGEATCRTVLAHYYAERNGQYEAGWTWSLARERTVGNTTLADIPDSATIEQYLKNPPVPLHDLNTEKILYAYNYGITKGVDAAGTFNPYGTLTRAEAAQFLYNARLTERTGAIKDGLLQ